MSRKPSRPLRLYRSGNGLVYAARSFDDVQRIARDTDAHGGWTLLRDSEAVTLRTTTGALTTRPAGRIASSPTLVRGLVYAPEELTCHRRPRPRRSPSTPRSARG